MALTTKNTQGLIKNKHKNKNKVYSEKDMLSAFNEGVKWEKSDYPKADIDLSFEDFIEKFKQ